MVQWKKIEVNSIKEILRNVQLNLKIDKQKSPNPAISVAKLGL